DLRALSLPARPSSPPRPSAHHRLSLSPSRCPSRRVCCARCAAACSAPGVIAYPSVSASTTPLGDPPSIWKKSRSPTLQRALSNRERASHETAASPVRGHRRFHSAIRAGHSAHCPPPTPIHSSHSPLAARPKHVPIVIPHYVPIVAPRSLCNSPALSSSKTSTAASSPRPSLSNFPLSGHRSTGSAS
ncbi:hypothetical protein BS50DRAFT_612472, partial [Corynespora cassiicola Philippines]